jgi:hypothetical protein
MPLKCARFCLGNTDRGLPGTFPETGAFAQQKEQLVAFPAQAFGSARSNSREPDARCCAESTLFMRSNHLGNGLAIKCEIQAM